MTPPNDYYQVLGVLRDAEQVVITAAYRALASIYHPDRWKGDAAEANRRMAEINVAYGVIGDVEKRAEYDRQYQSSTSSMGADAESVDEAFDAAMDGLESRWQKAVSVLPDLADTRKRLAKTAHRLAFAFVVLMLETKKFQHRKEIANELERKFLENHFGKNPRIISFAKDLIEIGNRNAIRALNGYIDVLGEDIDPKLIIDRVKEEFSINFHKAKQKNSADIEKLKKDIVVHGYIDSTIKLIELSGLFVAQIGNGLFMPSKYSIYKKDSSGFASDDLVVDSLTPGALVEWAKSNLC